LRQFHDAFAFGLLARGAGGGEGRSPLPAGGERNLVSVTILDIGNTFAENLEGKREFICYPRIEQMKLIFLYGQFCKSD